MATVMEYFVGKYLLKKIAAFAEEKVVMIHGVKDELKKLEKRMARIGAYLKDAERRRISDDYVKHWLNELKDVMYDADDMIDRWRYNNQSLRSDEQPSSSYSPTCFHFSLFSCFCIIPMRHEMAVEVKKLNVRLDDIFKDMSSLNLQHIQSEVIVVTRVDAPSSSPIIGVDVVGNEIEEGAKKLVKMATMDNEQKFNIVAITGMGGIGKTTLAPKIYNDPTIQNRYATKMWLSISQSYSPAQIIREAIRQAGNNHGQAERELELLPILASTISKKSFFLVLDDVWNPDIWDNFLQNPLKLMATQGFILVTTRDQSVAMQMGAKHIHQAIVLSHKFGWELLCKRAYLTDIKDVENLEDVGTKIVEKCGGLPLAIKTIAGMLAKRGKSKREWEDVLRNNAWSINGLPREINGAIYLSYEDLSPPLKQCFLSCSLYPSNGYRYRWDLVGDWIAEGFIEERKDQIIEDIAEEYYDELIRRHLLESDPLYLNNLKCKMHDVLRSLAQYLSMGESCCEDRELSDPIAISTLRRLSITETNESTCIPGPATDILRLRTFMIFRCLSQIENHIFLRLKHLRVLLINDEGLKNIPESIGNLIHLRMLDLDRTSITNLPNSIGSLKNLQILNLSDCRHLHTLPRGITQLCNLRRLRLRGTPLTSVPKGLGGLQKITEIWGFQVVSDGGCDKNKMGWDLQDLEQLSQLRRIRICNLEKARNVSAVLASKIHLRQLSLHYSPVLERSSGQMEELGNEKIVEVFENLCPPPGLEWLYIENYRDEMFPKWMSLSSPRDFLPNLQYLQLIKFSVCTDLPPLGLLSSLKYLKVNGASTIVKISLKFLGIGVWKSPNFTTAFPKLEFLWFEDMPNWEEWVLSGFEEENSPFWKLMPCIKQLWVDKCPKLGALPEGLQKLIAIEDLFVREADSIKSIQDFSFKCEVLETRNAPCLETLSNLTGVKKLRVVSAPNLSHVNKLDSLEYLVLEDYEMVCFPEWLTKLIEERRNNNTRDKLHLDLFCNTTLLKRCLKGGLDWSIIESFSSVSAYNKERSASLEYSNNEPESYYASL